MSESALAISTLYTAVDRIFTAATGDVVSALPRASDHLDRLNVLVRKIGALHEHVRARRDTLVQAAAATQHGEDENGDDAPWVTDPPPELFIEGPRPAIVEVVPGVSVPAMLLPASCDTLESVRDGIRGPMLCYVPSWGHFAVRLGPHVIHGNVGAIYPPGERRPRGVKECKAALCRGPACTYYHPPPNAKTEAAAVRNFAAASFMYQPRGAPHAARYGGRVIGDYRSLEADLNAISPAAARLFLDQVGHDLVCAVALLHHRPDLAAHAPGRRLPPGLLP